MNTYGNKATVNSPVLKKCLHVGVETFCLALAQILVVPQIPEFV